MDDSALDSSLGHSRGRTLFPIGGLLPLDSRAMGAFVNQERTPGFCYVLLVGFYPPSLFLI